MCRPLGRIPPFQSTPPHGRRRDVGMDMPREKIVSIHASAWEATSRPAWSRRPGWCFNPRLRMGGDPAVQCRSLGFNVSIHASAWEATGLRRRAVNQVEVSIHASAWEATSPLSVGSCAPPVSIHASAWEATIHVTVCHVVGGVSIHASAWEATYERSERDASRLVSIHASAWEATLLDAIVTVSVLFQSTPPHGRRPGAELAPEKRVLRRVSIHASAWEATPSSLRHEVGRALQKVSIHASAWEATLLHMISDTLSECVSIHASAWEATRPRADSGLERRLTVSIHASAWEATPRMGVRPLDGCTSFQSTPPHGRRRAVPGEIAMAYAGVSIHASAWEATPDDGRHQTGPISWFQSTPPHGRRPAFDAAILWTTAVGFQSTPPHGRRRASSLEFCLPTEPGGFNPRLRMGGDSRP